MMISRSKYRSSVEVCADCGASDPAWASINRGLLLCTECCSVHRSLGRHISHIKSLRQGSWPPSLLAMVQALTAQNVNSIWEHSLLDSSAPKHLRKKPQPRDPLHPVKSEFILAKHLRLAYVLRARRDEPPSELGRQLHSAVRSSSLDTAMRLLAQGADPNYYNQEKGSHCVHVACRAGQAAQAELLVAWGADPAALDADRRAPHHLARLAGHTELAGRMVELVHEATDRLVQYLTGARPDHAAGRHLLVPRALDHHQMTDGAKAARGKLQLLPNHLFEELVMDIYDEIDRRETEAIWQTSATGLERSGVVFLPVNPALSAPRNQGRQKLARLSAAEMATLLRDVLVDATRRQHIATLQPTSFLGPGNPLLSASHLKHLSQMSDDEPLYDSVASDEDYAYLAPELDMSRIVSRTEGNIASTYSASLPTELSLPELRRNNSPQENHDVEVLKKELDNKDTTITELKSQLKNLQTIVEQLTKENSVLKTTSSVDDELSTTSQLSMSETMDVVDTPKIQERGKSLDSEPIGMSEQIEVRQMKSPQRPVSMFEAREGPRNNWQVTKHQLTTLPALQRTLSSAGAGPGGATGAGAAGVEPPAADVTRGAEAVTRAIQCVWSAARSEPGSLGTHAAALRAAVAAFTLLFPQPTSDHELSLLLNELQMACEEVIIASSAPSPLNEVRSAAYELAKATKLIVTHYQPDAS